MAVQSSSNVMEAALKVHTVYLCTVYVVGVMKLLTNMPPFEALLQRRGMCTTQSVSGGSVLCQGRSLWHIMATPIWFCKRTCNFPNLGFVYGGIWGIGWNPVPKLWGCKFLAFGKERTDCLSAPCHSSPENREKRSRVHISANKESNLKIWTSLLQTPLSPQIIPDCLKTTVNWLDQSLGKVLERVVVKRVTFKPTVPCVSTTNTIRSMIFTYHQTVVASVNGKCACTWIQRQ